MPQYFEKWLKSKNQPRSPLSELEARTRHERGSPYVAVLMAEHGKCVIDLTSQWLSVSWLDERDRLYLRYDFNRVDPAKLFLSLALHIQYQDNGITPEMSMTFAFKRSGVILIERRSLVSGDVQEKESQASIDPNWDVYPSFGDYQSICRINRDGLVNKWL